MNCAARKRRILVSQQKRRILSVGKSDGSISIVLTVAQETLLSLLKTEVESERMKENEEMQRERQMLREEREQTIRDLSRIKKEVAEWESLMKVMQEEIDHVCTDWRRERDSWRKEKEKLEEKLKVEMEGYNKEVTERSVIEEEIDRTINCVERNLQEVLRKEFENELQAEIEKIERERQAEREEWMKERERLENALKVQVEEREKDVMERKMMEEEMDTAMTCMETSIKHFMREQFEIEMQTEKQKMKTERKKEKEVWMKEKEAMEREKNRVKQEKTKKIRMIKKENNTQRKEMGREIKALKKRIRKMGRDKVEMEEAVQPQIETERENAAGEIGASATLNTPLRVTAEDQVELQVHPADKTPNVPQEKEKLKKQQRKRGLRRHKKQAV